MTRSLLVMPNNANQVGAKLGSANPISGIQRAITNILKDKEPRKTWALLMDLLWPRIEMSERAAKHRVANTRSYSIEELQVLIQSDDGLTVLEALMDDAQPEWWKQLQKEISLCKARAHQALARQIVMEMEPVQIDVRSRRQLKRFSDADRRINSTMAEKETSVGLLRQDMGGAPDRAVAQTKGRR